jgi:hypothetical protein
MKTNDFKDKWNEFKGQNGYLQRLDPNHPLDFFIGISAKGYDELALMTVIEPAQLKSTKALEVEKNIRKDGKWATQIYSIDEANQDIFARLCMDLVDCSQACKSEAEGLSNVTRRYLTWQRLFSSIHETLSTKELKGLISEISFCRLLLDKNYGKDEVLEAWMGPEGADRDFTFPKVWYEIKGIATGKDFVRISSLNQLEINYQGFLIINRIDESSSTDTEAFSVKKYINDFRVLLEDAPNAADLFEKKLVSARYIEKKQYEDIYFKFNGIEFYKVDEIFPKLVTENVAAEIVRVEYDLSLPGIQPWKIGEKDIWS